MTGLRGFRTLALALALASGLGSAARAASLEGLTFDDSVKVGEAELKLNGLGLRSVVFIKAYVGGLYVAEKSASAATLLAAKPPKRLELRLLRDTDAADFKKALVGGMKNNASEADFARLAPRVAELEKMIDAIVAVKKGDMVLIDFTAAGVVVLVNGAAKGAAIAGDDFARVLLSIFIGENPVDGKLKKGLLGGH